MITAEQLKELTASRRILARESAALHRVSIACTGYAGVTLNTARVSVLDAIAGIEEVMKLNAEKHINKGAE